MHKMQYQQKQTPPALYELAQLAFGVDNYYNTRYAANQNLYRPSSRTNYGLARFSIVESQTWETIPIEVKCLPYNTFKKEYIKLLLLDCQEWITFNYHLVLFIYLFPLTFVIIYALSSFNTD